MATRKQNEAEYHFWEELPDGGRRYWKQRPGVKSGYQQIVKFVDSNEVTLLVLQEVYNDDGKLIEKHQKFPSGSEHKYVGGDK
jgi:hypothetical protein